MSTPQTRIRFPVGLRRQQLDYLEELQTEAEVPLYTTAKLQGGTDLPISHILEAIIERSIQPLDDAPADQAPVKKQLFMRQDHALYVDNLAHRMGVTRSEVVRHLIETARSKGFRL